MRWRWMHDDHDDEDCDGDDDFDVEDGDDNHIEEELIDNEQHAGNVRIMNVVHDRYETIILYFRYEAIYSLPIWRPVSVVSVHSLLLVSMIHMQYR